MSPSNGDASAPHVPPVSIQPPLPTPASREGSGEKLSPGRSSALTRDTSGFSISNDGTPQPVKSAAPEVPVAVKAGDGAYSSKADLNLDLDARSLPLDEAAVTKGMWHDFKRRPDEVWYRYAGRLCSEGHSIPDAFLTVAASQIGQIMLTSPNALWKAGLISGGLFMLLAICGSFFTIYLMNVLYVEYRRAKLTSGAWKQGVPHHVTQYHDVMGFHAGKVIGYTAQTFVVLQLLGTGIAQVIACAGDWYSVDKQYSKRELQMFWGAALQVFAFFPSFRHFRVLNILALAGTTMTAVYLLYEANSQGYGQMDNLRLWPVTVGAITAPQYFFTGSAVLLNALGGHAIAIEMMDAMESPMQYSNAYMGGWLWTMFLIIPPSISVNLAFPTVIGGADNVYGAMPMSKAKVASVSLMIIHQLAAFAYYVSPVFYIWERFIRTHNKPWYIRLPSRLPVSLLIWLAAMAFPFYGAINSLMASISVPFTAFALPCLVYCWIYRKQASRDAAPLPPFKIFQAANWRPLFAICIITAVFFVGFGATAIAYSIKTINDNAASYGLFAPCYQCPANWQSLLRNPDSVV